jgi:hypothetical protein
MAKTFRVNGLSTGVTYTTTPNASWITLSQNGNIVTVTAASNNNVLQDREAYITVAASDGAGASLRVKQDKHPGTATPPPTSPPTPTADPPIYTPTPSPPPPTPTPTVVPMSMSIGGNTALLTQTELTDLSDEIELAPETLHFDESGN